MCLAPEGEQSRHPNTGPYSRRLETERERTRPGAAGKWFATAFRYRLVRVERWHGRLEPQMKHDWFTVSLGIQVAGEYVNLLLALVAWLRSTSSASQYSGTSAGPLFVPLEKGGNVSIPFSRVRHILDTLFELTQKEALDAEGRLTMSLAQLARLAELTEEDDAPPISWSGEEDLLTLVERLREVDRIAIATPPKGLQAHLRDYQRQGLDWLQFLQEYLFFHYLDRFGRI